MPLRKPCDLLQQCNCTRPPVGERIFGRICIGPPHLPIVSHLPAVVRPRLAKTVPQSHHLFMVLAARGVARFLNADLFLDLVAHVCQTQGHPRRGGGHRPEGGDDKRLVWGSSRGSQIWCRSQLHFDEGCLKSSGHWAAQVAARKK